MIENLLLKIEQYNPQADMGQVIKAYTYDYSMIMSY